MVKETQSADLDYLELSNTGRLEHCVSNNWSSISFSTMSMSQLCKMAVGFYVGDYVLGDFSCRMTKGEFRRLTDQVRDVNMNLKNKFRSSNCQKLYPVQNKTSDHISQVYHSQLSSSLKAFQTKAWKPLKDMKIEPSIVRYRPATSVGERRQKLAANDTTIITPPSLPTRPRSVPSGRFRPASSYRRPETPEVQPGNFDTLDPETLANLIGPERPVSVYGERCVISNCEDDSEADDDDDLKSTTSAASDASSLERGDEPEVDTPRTIPELNLRPEDLDALYVPVDRQERKRYDFDASTVDVPTYEFSNPIPKTHRHLEFAIIAKQGLNWRNLTDVPNSKIAEKMFDRLIQLEKMQIATIESEIRNRSRPTSRRSSGPRGGSAKNTRSDKRCISSCVQLACVGDCPEKHSNSVCEMCQQTFCSGLCSASYDLAMRQSPVEESPKPTRKQTHRFCTACLKKHNAKFINANNVLLGRPRSSNATFSRGNNSVKPKDPRPHSTADIPSEAAHQMSKMGIDSASRPSTAMSYRPRSRNGLLPGKTFSSNRKCSITETRSVKRSRSAKARISGKTVS